MTTKSIASKLLFPAIGLGMVVVTVLQLQFAQSSRASTLPRAASAVAPEQTRIATEGRVVSYPDAEVTVGTDVAGVLERVLVKEKQRIRRGELLAIIRADDMRAGLAEATARVAEADADIRLFESEVARTHNLFKEDVGSKQAWEKAERDVDAARARRQTAAAEVSRLAAVLAKTRITSPIDGIVIARPVDSGETIAIGDSVATIADLSRTRIEAEVDEFDAGRIRLGSEVVVSAEGYAGDKWAGTVEEIPDNLISRRLKPQDPSKPVDTRVLLVKVALAKPTPLKLGQRVDVSIVVK
jgi:HlyD family secretion protein